MSREQRIELLETMNFMPILKCKFCTISDCIVPLTVVHIIVECPNYIESRARYLGDNIDIKSVLDDTGPVQTGGKLYKFLIKIVFNKIQL